MTHYPFPARAMSSREIAAMREAVRQAADHADVSAASVAVIVYELYSSGVTDPVKLAEAASLLATSRTFN